MRKSLLTVSIFIASVLLLAGLTDAMRWLRAQELADRRGVGYGLESLVADPLADVTPYGVNVYFAGQTDEEVARSLAMIQAVGLRWIRLHLTWANVEARRSTLDWSQPDRWIDLCGQHGLQVILVVDGAPEWARQDPLPTAPPDDPQTYAAFLAAAARHYQGRVRCFQVWDDPNIAPNWGSGHVDPAAYTALLQAAYRAAKEANPACVILSAGLAPNWETGGKNLNELDFLRRMYQAGAKGCFDVLGAKPYGFWETPDDRRFSPEVLNFSRLVLLREIMAEFGDSDTPVWAVAFGWNALPADWAGRASTWGSDAEDRQAARTVEAIGRARAEWPWLGVMTLACFRWAGDPADPVRGFALVEPDFTPRLLYQELHRLLHAPPAAPPGDHGPTNPAITWGPGWQRDAAEASVIVAGAAGPTATIRFQGTRLDVLAQGGALDVALDGGPFERVTLGQPGQTTTLVRHVADALHQADIRVAAGLVSIRSFLVAREKPLPPYDPAIALLLAALAVNLLCLLRAIPSLENKLRSRRIARSAAGPLDLAIQREHLRPTGCAPRMDISLENNSPFAADRQIRRRAAGSGDPAGTDFHPAGCAPRVKVSSPSYPSSFSLPLALMLLALAWYQWFPGDTLAFLGLFALAVLGARRPVLLLGLIALTAPFYLSLWRFASITEMLVLTSAAAWLLRAIWTRDWRALWPRRADLPALFFVAVGVLSLLAAEHRGVALRELRTVVAEPVLLFALVTRAVTTRRQAGFLAGMLILAGVLAAMWGVGQFALGRDVITAEGVWRVRAAYPSPNNLGLFLGRILPLAAALALGSVRWRERSLYALAALIIGAGLVLTFSRGAWLGVSVALLFLGLLEGRRVLLAILGVLAAGLLALISLGHVARISSLLNLQEGTSFLRLKLWQASLRMALDHPLQGVGLDNFLYQYPRYRLPEAWAEPNLSHPHNVILDWWLRLGTLGLVALVVLLADFFRRAFRTMRAADATARALALGLAASMVEALAHGLIDNSYFLVDLATVFMLTYGLAAALDRMGSQPEPGS